MESKKVTAIASESRRVAALGWGVGENRGVMLVKELKPLVMRWLSSGDLMHSVVTILLYFISVLPFHTANRVPKNCCF